MQAEVDERRFGHRGRVRERREKWQGRCIENEEVNDDLVLCAALVLLFFLPDTHGTRCFNLQRALGQHSKQTERKLTKARDKADILQNNAFYLRVHMANCLGHFYEGVSSDLSDRRYNQWLNEPQLLCTLICRVFFVGFVSHEATKKNLHLHVQHIFIHAICGQLFEAKLSDNLLYCDNAGSNAIIQ